MKTAFLGLALCLFVSSAFAQNPSTKSAPVIHVPAFADPDAKKFYQSYADHLIKCIQAIREKNESRTRALFKDPGEKLVAKEKILSQEIVKDPVEKEKYMAFAVQVYPYLKEVQQSAYYIKMYGKQ